MLKTPIHNTIDYTPRIVGEIDVTRVKK